MEGSGCEIKAHRSGKKLVQVLPKTTMTGGAHGRSETRDGHNSKDRGGKRCGGEGGRKKKKPPTHAGESCDSAQLGSEKTSRKS